MKINRIILNKWRVVSAFGGRGGGEAEFDDGEGLDEVGELHELALGNVPNGHQRHPYLLRCRDVPRHIQLVHLVRCVISLMFLFVSFLVSSSNFFFLPHLSFFVFFKNIFPPGEP